MTIKHRRWSPNIRSRRIEILEQRVLLTVAPTVTGLELANSSWDQAFTDHLQTSGLGTYGYSVPAGSSQEQTLPWIGLDRLYITFSEDVHVDAQDLSVSGVNLLQYETADFFYDPQLRTARWTFSQPLETDRILFDLDADGADPIIDLDGNALDGEWTNSSSTFASGDGTAGGDFEFTINSLVGDATQDNGVSYYDYIYAMLSIGQDTTNQSYNVAYDLDGSGEITSTDSSSVLSRLGDTLPTGDPAGISNDAPTASGLVVQELDDPAINEAFSLYDLFDDVEDEDSELSFSIASNSAPSLFDTAYIDSQTGELVLNTAASASGRAKIEITATDTGGLSVTQSLVFDVAYQNLPPQITDYFISSDSTNTYYVEGVVTDPDEDTTGWIVEFSGVFTARAVVYSNGFFSFTVTLPPGSNGFEEATVADMFDAMDTESAWIGTT